MSAEPFLARPHQAMGPGAEFDTIRLLMARWGDLAVDIGDDAAVLGLRATPPAGEGTDDRRLVVSTDAFVENAHFRAGWISPTEIGARAIAAALSDLAAMGAQADAVLLAFSVPDSWRGPLGEVADGVARVLRPTGARIVGGNLTRGAAFGITTTVIGSTHAPISRGGARPGDILLLTGTLGGPGAAISAWDAGQEPTAWARSRFAGPLPRLAEGAHLAQSGVHAMLDISDGLAADARHLAAASGVRLRIDAERVPVGEGIRPVAALASGEEYELLAAASPEVARRLLASWSQWTDVPLTPIGEVLEADVTGPVDIAGLAARDRIVEFVHGHDHFSS